FVGSFVAVLFFFFFQAEDGIRDRNVTGVQTCALPISGVAGSYAILHRVLTLLRAHLSMMCLFVPACAASVRVHYFAHIVCAVARSEERRVGKECGSGGAGD